MESVQNAAWSAYNTASKLIFGEGDNSQGADSTQEPVSGAQGRGTAEQPFDQGNKEDLAAGASSSGISSTVPSGAQRYDSSEEPVSGVQGGGTATDPYDQGNKEDLAATSGGVVGSGSVLSSTGAAGRYESGEEPISGEQGRGTAEEPFDQGNKDAGVLGTGGPSSGPSSGVSGLGTGPASTSGTGPLEAPTPLHAHQGADRPTEEPPSGGQQDVVKAAREDGAEEAITSSSSLVGVKSAGEQHVKSTGVAADGGDFDATRPGAGAEASRLLEEKGVHRDGDSGGASASASAGASTDVDDSKVKPKFSEKIKEKLHLRKH